MKTRDIAKILRSKMSTSDKKKLLEREIDRPSTGKIVAGVVVATLLATGIAKFISNKMKEKQMLKDIENQEEVEFWDAYYEKYGSDIEDELDDIELDDIEDLDEEDVVKF